MNNVEQSKCKPVIRREFESICTLIDTVIEKYKILDEKIIPILYVGPTDEEPTNECIGTDPCVNFAAELIEQKYKLIGLIKKIEDTTKRVEI